LISRVAELYGPHGYCADDRWMLRFEESVVIQGDTSGTAHPNSAGYAHTAELIADVVGASLESGSEVRFLRGDADGNATLDLTDAIRTLGFLFQGDAEPSCLDAADFNDDGAVDVSDAISSLGYQFLGGAPAPLPGSATCGPDATEDALSCESFTACES